MLYVLKETDTRHEAISYSTMKGSTICYTREQGVTCSLPTAAGRRIRRGHERAMLSHGRSLLSENENGEIGCVLCPGRVRSSKWVLVPTVWKLAGNNGKMQWNSSRGPRKKQGCTVQHAMLVNLDLTQEKIENWWQMLSDAKIVFYNLPSGFWRVWAGKRLQAMLSHTSVLI